MPKIDLITGFLGSGKTTFVKCYAQYLMDAGYRIGIVENDHGAVNIDTMLLSPLEGENCELESVAGGCDADCHRRRFKTKLIAMGMLGYDRVLVEPSGVYDVEAFFDVLREDVLDSWYEIGSVICIVDGALEEELTEAAQKLLAMQAAGAGMIVLSKAPYCSKEKLKGTVEKVNRALERFGYVRRFDMERADGDVLGGSWQDYGKAEFERIMTSGWHAADHRYRVDLEKTFDTLYYFKVQGDVDSWMQPLQRMMTDTQCGHIFRIKGFFKTADPDEWIEINVTREGAFFEKVPNGQEVIIIIGEQLYQAAIDRYMGRTAGSMSSGEFNGEREG